MVSGTTSMKIKALIKQSPGPKVPGLLRSGLLKKMSLNVIP